MHVIQLLMRATYLMFCASITNGLEYDFIVVGVGSGGSIMASRLSEPDNNWTVLALDRGSARDPNLQDAPGDDLSGVHDPNYFSTPQNYLLGRLVRNPAYYGLGGTAMTNGMVTIAPSRNLLDNLWPTGWKWDDLFPYMLKMQNHYCYYLPSSLTDISDEDCRKWHGRGGPMDIAPPLFEQMPEPLLALKNQCNESIGFMTDSDNPTQKSGCYFVHQFRKPLNRSDPNSPSVRASTWAAYLSGVSRPNLQILDSATVLKLVFDENEPTKCIGVRYEYKGQIYTAIARKEVILCAGVFDTPKLLQLSGVGPKEWLEPFGIKIVAENSHVGNNFVDKMASFMAFETIRELPAAPLSFRTFALITSSGLKESNKNWTDIQIYFYSTSPNLTFDDPFYGYDPILAYSKPPVPLISFLVYHTQPEASGTVKIQSPSPYDRPQIDHGWHNLSEYDRKNLQFSVDLIRKMMNNMTWGKTYVKQELFPGNRFNGSDQLYRQLSVGSGYHPIGTCGLGKCTNNEARVLGIKNVRIADVSLFPTQINVNPMYILYSMCEKVADLIKKEHAQNRSTGIAIYNRSNFTFVIFITLFLFMHY